MTSPTFSVRPGASSTPMQPPPPSVNAFEDERGERIRPFDRALFWRLARVMARYPGRMWTVLALAIVLATLGSTIPFVLSETIRGPIEDPAGFSERFGVSADAGLWGGVVVMLLLAAGWYVAMRWRQLAVGDLTESVVRDLRREIYAHLQRLGMDYYDRTKVGRILARGTGDLDAIRGAVMQVAPRVVISVVQMAYALAVMMYYDRLLGLLVMIAAPILYVVNWRFRQSLSDAFRATQETFSLITANLAESIAGMRVTQAFTREARNLEIFRDLCHQHRDRHLAGARAQGLYLPLVDIVGQLFVALALVVGGQRVVQGLMTPGELLGFMIMAGVFLQPVTVIGDMYNVTLQALAGAERVFRLLDTKPAALEPASDVVQTLPKSTAGMRVEFRDVTFSYRPGRPVLHSVSFPAEPGKTIALVGHTGAGKTSIINLVAKFYRHDSGTILLDGIDIGRISPRDLHRHTAIVLQHNILFSGTVLDNILFARPEATRGRAIEACAQLGCREILERLPRGLDTPVGERGEALSLGQRQLTCFARAMLAEPRLLILDEATSSVDPVTEAAVQEALSRLLWHRTSFVVAHRLSTIRRADLILVVDAGRIVESGNHESLIAQGGIYRELYHEFVRLSRGEDGAAASESAG